MPWVFVRALVWALGPGALPSGPDVPTVPEAPAAPPVADLHWSAPDDCPRADEIKAMVVHRLGDDAERPPLRVDATVTAAREGFVLDLRLRRADQDDRRRIESARCEALGRATALIVALALDPVAVARTLAATPTSTAPPPPPVPETPPAEEPPQPSLPPPPATPQPQPTAPPPSRSSPPTPRPSPTLHIGAEGGAQLGALPGISGLGGLATALTWPALRVELAGVVLTPRTREASGAGVRVMLGAVALRACLRIRRSRIEVPLCGGVEAGAMRGDGRRAPQARTGHGPWVAAVIGPGLRVPWGERIGLYARLDVVAAPIRAGFQIRGLGGTEVIFEPAPVSGRAVLGIDVRIAGPGDGNPVRRRNRG